MEEKYGTSDRGARGSRRTDSRYVIHYRVLTQPTLLLDAEFFYEKCFLSNNDDYFSTIICLLIMDSLTLKTIAQSLWEA